LTCPAILTECSISDSTNKKKIPVTKVILLIPTLDRSGAEKQLTHLAIGLPHEEFDVEVIALTRGGPYEEQLKAAGIPLTIIGKRWKFDPFALRRLRKLIAGKQPDILHTWLFAANAYGRMVVGFEPAPKVVVSERCVDSWKAGWQLWCDRKLTPRTDRLIGNSQAVAAFYADLGFPRDRLLVIPNGIEPATDSTRTRQSICDEFDFPVDSKIIGCVGRLAPQKRVSDLIWAMELLQSLQPSSRLLIIGDGPQRKALEDFARNIRLSDVIRFAGHRSDVANILPHMDMFCLASDFEGQSNSLMEAMAHGLPVVVSDIAPNVELVEHEKTGLVVPVGDRPAFTRACDRLIKDESLGDSLGKAAKDYIIREHSFEKAVVAHAALYRTLVGQSNDDSVAG
jgi:glycosyltransferase involved in cell wall biosynthesis